MTPQEFAILKNIEGKLDYSSKKKTVIAEALDGSLKTLIYGYTHEKNTHHLYQEDGQLHLAIYNHKNEIINHISDNQINILDVLPKRIYAEGSDFDFCKNLKENDVELRFANYNFSTFQKLQERKGLTGKSLDDLGIINNNFKP